MGTLTVLTDDEVRTILHGLTCNDALNMQASLAEGLHTYSTGTQDMSACAANQPHRSSVKQPDGSTTLFMPSMGPGKVAMKIVTLAESSSPPPSDASKTSLASTTSSTTSTSGSSMALDGASIASTASTASTASGTSTAPSSVASGATTSPAGSVTLLDGQGQLVGIINASTLTAFRTALAATMILKRREHVSTVTVFGAGQQAYWHIRLALLLRGADIKRVNIVNRSFARAQPLLEAFYGVDGRESAETAPWRAHGTRFSVLTPEYGEYARLLKEEVRKADVIFCCTPALEPLFPAEHLTATEGRKKGRYVAAIGSYRRHMCELHPDILRQAAAPPHAHHHHHRHARSDGVVVVDSLSATLREAGEIIQAGLAPDQLVELGELVMLKRQHHQQHGAPAPAPDAAKAASDGGLMDWLAKGNVIYKSVGLGLMDLTVGWDLLRLANERGVGTRIDGF